jgi:hypothetical protein
MPINIAAMFSHLPWPKGCSLSGFLDDNFVLAIITIELKESDKVCQASAIIETDPETIPAQYLRANSAIFTIMETIPPM